MSTLEERFKRNELDDKLYIGALVEQHIQGEFGTLLKCLIEGLKAECLNESGSGRLNADRYLGRLESLNHLQDRLEDCIQMKQRLEEEEKQKAQV